MSRLRPLHWIVAALALVVLALSLWRLEGVRQGIEILRFEVGTTPATLYRLPGGDRRLVVVSHGFAGSRQLMEAWSLTLARNGLAVVAFDYEGHGRNSVPMSGDVTSVEGTTRLLVDETRRVTDAALALPGVTGPVAILGHSMASDVIVRTAATDPRITDVVAISMFSEAVTADHPRRLLIITGQWEAYLRAAALDALRLVDPAGQEGQTLAAGEVRRRAVVAPMVEHVGVLYSATGLREARDWLGGEGATTDPAPVAATGGAILAMLAAIVALGWPLSRLLPQARRPTAPLPPGRFALAVIAPALAAPLIATRIDTGVLPVLVADYLVVHLLILGVLQLAVLRWAGVSPGPVRPLALAALLVWGLLVFGGALDRYVASFWPSGTRWGIVALLALGTIPAMLADTTLSDAGQAPLWRRIGAKAAFFASLALAVALDFERLFFLLIVVPVIVLFFLVYGLMGRWAGRGATAATVGLGLGVILAWALGVTFPLFAA
ncbi:alpha/beta fold hydrolase [Palleronia sp. KMU-117]|uniref:alpha/beta fold hydrolase n=1 Tax=Palleronia sp. KMU-117 TaxID=3434108 RepID=UPI003D717C87